MKEDEPTLEEVKETIKSSKNATSPENNNINVELKNFVYYLYILY